MSRQRQIKAKSPTHEVTVHDHESDSPIIPIVQIERLHAIRPDKVDWIFEQTEKDAEARRIQAKLINTFIFIERMCGMIFALVIGLSGLGIAAWLAYHDKQIAASSIGGVTLVSLVSTFIVSSRKK